jgi:hypothetical protein
MKMADPKWLTLYAWVVLVASLIETVLIVSGDYQTRLIMAGYSIVTIAFGFAASALVIGGHLAFAKAARSIVGASYCGQLETIANLIFWFGIAGSAAMVLTHPMLAQDHIRFSIGPVGIGFALGAKWAFNRYNPTGTHGT